MPLLQNYVTQTTTYGGFLTFPPVGGYPEITIPLYLGESDIPVRQPKITEINTIPVIDEAVQYDGTTQAIFFGAAEPLGTTISGFLITPVVTSIDGISGGQVSVYKPTVDGTASGAPIGLIGVSYGDLIWAYLEGSINTNGPSIYTRTDPLLYGDPFGNVYVQPIIQTFTCTQTVALTKQNFTMTMKLEA